MHEAATHTREKRNERIEWPYLLITLLINHCSQIIICLCMDFLHCISFFFFDCSLSSGLHVEWMKKDELVVQLHDLDFCLQCNREWFPVDTVFMPGQEICCKERFVAWSCRKAQIDGKSLQLTACWSFCDNVHWVKQNKEIVKMISTWRNIRDALNVLFCIHSCFVRTAQIGYHNIFVTTPLRSSNSFHNYHALKDTLFTIDCSASRKVLSRAAGGCAYSWFWFCRISWSPWSWFPTLSWKQRWYAVLTFFMSIITNFFSLWGRIIHLWFRWSWLQRQWVQLRQW